MDFDPSIGDHLDQLPVDARAAYPDAAALIREHEAEHEFRPDCGYFIARVPRTRVYVLYGVNEAAHVISLVCIREHTGSTN